MANIHRVRVSWDGGKAVGPSMNTYYFTDATTVRTALQTFYTALAPITPNGNSFTIPNSGDTLEDSTGVLTGGWASGSTITVNSSGGPDFWAGVGARIVWPTNGITRGRRVKGSSFICPLAEQFADSSGTVQADALTVLNNAASAFVTAVSPGLLIWSRPKLGFPGSSHAVLSGSCPDKVSWLRSRRV